MENGVVTVLYFFRKRGYPLKSLHDFWDTLFCWHRRQGTRCAGGRSRISALAWFSFMGYHGTVLNFTEFINRRYFYADICLVSMDGIFLFLLIFRVGL